MRHQYLRGYLRMNVRLTSKKVWDEYFTKLDSFFAHPCERLLCPSSGIKAAPKNRFYNFLFEAQKYALTLDIVVGFQPMRATDC